ncbi:MAG: HlyD family efflux transporter periplasmic adaptor subunit [Proteobacteria bacterium]|uniref:HlyD family efflux transporter periplasmic adaptor subunit n=1 Tax=Candidatus Avisuccinivibrio stercorigallinarum TaxID=2840704 RepID=A0A9D9DAN6_9GAMM|nr:HlyD family efflux transporter periplasmic adaptor subunit [Candidatus Avisuccinivibrio stercorigallinarum]
MNLLVFSQRPAVKTLLLFVILLCAAALLIMLGRRNDAVTQAQQYHAGVLCADDVNLAPVNVGGRLRARHVRESDVVQQGDLLLELEDDDYRIAAERIQAQIESQQAQIEAYSRSIEIESSKLDTQEQNSWREIERQLALIDSAQASLKEQQANFKRMQSLLAKKAVSKSDYDAAEASYVAAKSTLTEAQKTLSSLTVGVPEAELEKVKTTRTAEGLRLQAIADERDNIANMQNTLASMRASLKELQAELAAQELNLSRTKLYAPCSGIIRELMFEEGELVNPGVTALRLETTRRYFDVYVPETMAARLHAGDSIEVYAPALDKTVSGHVRYVNPAPSFADLRMSREQGQADLTSFEMRVYVDDPELIPGMMLEVEEL